MNKNKPVKKPVVSQSFKNKMLGVLGLRSDEDTHNIDRTMQSVAESIARLTELVESIDERVIQLDIRVAKLENHIDVRITKSEQAIVDSWDDCAQEIYTLTENTNIATQNWVAALGKKLDKIVKKVIEPNTVSEDPQPLHLTEQSIDKLAEAVIKLHDVVVALDARVGKLEKSVSALKTAQEKQIRKAKN